jgi:hypothetical protein
MADAVYRRDTNVLTYLVNNGQGFFQPELVALQGSHVGLPGQSFYRIQYLDQGHQVLGCNFKTG